VIDMPYTIEYVDQGRGVRSVGSGVVTGDEIRGALEAVVRGAPARAPTLRYAVVDLSGVTDLRVTPKDVRVIATEDRALQAVTPGGVVAIIAPEDHVFGMARMWETLVEDGWETHVFRTAAEADGWSPLQRARG
jgi:hypothetical protein